MTGHWHRNGRALATAWLAIAGFAIGAPVYAQQVIAVLSSDSKAYQEALTGFQEAYGQAVPTFNLSKEKANLNPSPAIVVSFGGKAALYPYPENAILIYCLSPALYLSSDQHPGPRIRIPVAPRPDIFMDKLKEIQPKIKRFAMIDIPSSPGISEYYRTYQRVASAVGVELRVEYLQSAEELPDRLRSLVGKTDALWLAPNPSIMTPSNFSMAKEFSSANDIPLYVPVESLVDQGATGTIAASFREMGRTAGRIARKIANGATERPESVFPDKCDVVLNLSAAAKSGLVIPDAVVKKAERIVP